MRLRLAGHAASLLLLLLAALAPCPDRAVAAGGDETIEEALDDVLDMEEELVETAREARALTVAVVNKRYPRNKGERIEGAPAQPVGGGSGVLLERKEKLWIVTNVHVVKGADEVTVVTPDGVERSVEVHDTIPQYDIALLAFPSRPRGLGGYPLNSTRVRVSRNLEEGAWVVATGNPFGLAMDGHAVTTLGVLSGKDRILGGEFLYGNALQHDAEVNPGNSGGPLWNRKGDLLGINGMIATRPRAAGAGPSNTGASFSIPLYQVDSFLMAMIEQRKDAQAGWVGITFETAVDGKGKPVGARVTAIEPKSPVGPSARKGLKPGDIIVSIWGFGDDHRIRTASDVTNLLSLCREGTYLKIKYKSGSRYYEWSGRLPARPDRRGRH
jgi:serine protease Do